MLGAAVVKEGAWTHVKTIALQLVAIRVVEVVMMDVRIHQHKILDVLTVRHIVLTDALLLVPIHVKGVHKTVDVLVVVLQDVVLLVAVSVPQLAQEGAKTDARQLVLVVVTMAAVQAVHPHVQKDARMTVQAVAKGIARVDVALVALQIVRTIARLLVLAIVTPRVRLIAQTVVLVVVREFVEMDVLEIAAASVCNIVQLPVEMIVRLVAREDAKQVA